MITRPNASATPLAPIPPRPAKTSAKVATASVRQRRGSDALIDELADQGLHPDVDLVADATDGREVPARGVVERPVLVALARVYGAGVTAAHRDHDIGGADSIVGERLRELLAHVDAHLLHRVDH